MDRCKFEKTITRVAVHPRGGGLREPIRPMITRWEKGNNQWTGRPRYNDWWGTRRVSPPHHVIGSIHQHTILGLTWCQVRCPWQNRDRRWGSVKIATLEDRLLRRRPRCVEAVEVGLWAVGISYRVDSRFGYGGVLIRKLTNGLPCSLPYTASGFTALGEEGRDRRNDILRPTPRAASSATS